MVVSVLGESEHFGRHRDAELYLSQPALGSILADHPRLGHPANRAGPLRPQPPPRRRGASMGLLRDARITRRQGRVRVTVTVMAAAVLALSLSACTGSRSKLPRGVITYFVGAPSGITPPASSGAPTPIVDWAGPNRIYVVVSGSSTCPRLPTTVQADGQHRVIIKIKDHLTQGGRCSGDVALITSTVELPSAIDPSTPDSRRGRWNSYHAQPAVASNSTDMPLSGSVTRPGSRSRVLRVPPRVCWL
jgi:hypothetical protein